MNEEIQSHPEDEKGLSAEELQELEDEILNDASGGSSSTYPISPNIGC